MKKFFLLLAVCLFFFPWQAHCLKVSGVNIDSNKSPEIVVSLDTFQPLTIEQIDPETLVLHFPQHTQWDTQTSNTLSNGPIKSFTYVPYEDGAGDLVFKIDPSLKMNRFGAIRNKDFGISFSPPAQVQQVPFVINGVKIGQKEGKTRLVIEMNRVVNFILKENQTNTKVILIPAEKPVWKPQASFAKPIGRFENYKVYDTGREIAIEISVIPGTKVLENFLIDAQTLSPKLVVDFGFDPGVAVLNPAQINALNASHEKSAGLSEAPLDQEENLGTPTPGLVKKMDIITQGDDTILRLETGSNKNFEIVENTYTNQVIIRLPKTDWKNVEIPRSQGGLIQGFTIDQTSPNFTSLVLDVQKDTHVIGHKQFGSLNSLSRFIVYLNQNESKTPTWLIEETVEGTSYRDRDLNAIETSRLVYRGGISPYMNIGEGFYIGAQLDQLASENTSHSNNNSNQPRKMAPDNFGGGGHLYAGYGFVYDRLYGGLEFRLGGYGVDEKASQKNLVTTSSTSQIGLSWDVSTRLGGYISPTTLLYARLGVASTNFSYDGTSNATGQYIFPGKFSKNSRTGFLFGAGLESALSDQLSLRVEGAQINYQGINYITPVATKKDRNILNQVSVGMSYKPSPMAGPSMGSFFEESVGNGFYFGFNAGIGNMMNVRTVDGKNAAGAATLYKGQAGSSEPVWGLFGGYSYNIGRFFVATELQGSLNSFLIQESLSNPAQSYSNKMKWLWALTARPGYIFNHGTIGYGRLGVVGGSLTHKASFAGNTRQFTSGPNTTVRTLGVRTGGGLEVFINPQVSLRADYTFDYFPRVTFKDPTISGVSEKITIINNEFTLGLAYTLP